MSAIRKTGALFIGVPMALGALAMGIDWAAGTLSGFETPTASPEVRALTLTWERTHCFDCEAPAEPGASEARARARPRG